LRLVKRGGVGDPLAPLLSGKGIDEQMRRADQPRRHGSGGLDGQQFIDQGLVEPAAKLGQRFGQHKVCLRAVEVDVFDATGIHHRQVGTQPLADGSVGGAHFVFEQLQRQQQACWNRPTTTRRAVGETPGNAFVDGLDHLSPGKRIAPWADGIGFGDDVGNPQACSATAEPMLKVAYQTHREASFEMGSGWLRIRLYAS
jgi:hypothetical protein